MKEGGRGEGRRKGEGTKEGREGERKEGRKEGREGERKEGREEEGGKE